MDESSSSSRSLSSRKGTAARPNIACHNSARRSLRVGHLPPSQSLSQFRQTVIFGLRSAIQKSTVDETKANARTSFEPSQLISVAARRALCGARPGAAATLSASARFSALPGLAVSRLVGGRVLTRGVATPP